MYEGHNETYNYEKGEWATVDLQWDDAKKTLTIGPRQRSFPGMIAEQQLNIVIATPERNAGLKPGTVDVKTIRYTGESIMVKF